MSQGRERINPDKLWKVLNDDDSVVEGNLEFGALGGRTGNQSGVIFERRAKTPQDDKNLGFIPQLLQQPELFEELIGQLVRGEIKDATESRNPKNAFIESIYT